MAYVEVEIPITDDAGSNTLYYYVRYKLSSSDIWVVLTPNPIESPITIVGLLEDSSYDIEATRYCGVAGTNTTYASQPAVITVDTTA